MIETTIPAARPVSTRSALALIWRDSAAILAAFTLGVIATLGYRGLTGGFYEYHAAYPNEYPALINDQGWMIDREFRRGDGVVYQLILKRPRLMLP